jgi:hypothetical protein
MSKPVIDFDKVELKDNTNKAMKTNLFNVTKRKGNKMLDFEVNEIENILTSLEKRLKKEKKEYVICIKAICPTGIKTLKSYDGNLRLSEYDDYFDGKVLNSDKFSKISKLAIYIKYE